MGKMIIVTLMILFSMNAMASFGHRSVEENFGNSSSVISIEYNLSELEWAQKDWEVRFKDDISNQDQLVILDFDEIERFVKNDQKGGLKALNKRLKAIVIACKIVQGCNPPQ